MVKKNNAYLKDITDTVGGDASGVHTDNYYLKEIANNISGGGGGGDITVDSELSTTSENPVQNKVLTEKINFLYNSVGGLSLVAFTGKYTDLTEKPVLDFVKVTTDKGTASASTMDKLYIEVGVNKTDAYYTVENNGVYSWKKFDEDILDDLSIDWNDIANKPSIPSKTSDLTNDSGFLTQHQDISGKANISDLSTVATTGDYDDLTNKPDIPSKTSDLTNDSDFVESNELDSLELVITYQDSTTETVNITTWSDD